MYISQLVTKNIKRLPQVYKQPKNKYVQVFMKQTFINWIRKINTLQNFLQRFMNTVHRVFITGANRGLGKELVKMVHQKNPQLQMHLTSRLKSSEFAAQLQGILPQKSFKCHELDLNSTASIKELAQKLKHQEVKFDYIVANAAYGTDFGQKMPTEQIASKTLKTNFDSTIDFIKQFLPLLTNEGRVVIVSSLMGALSEHKESIRNKLQDNQITQEELLKLSRDYIEAAKHQNMGDFHWSAYRTSKAFLNTWARFILPKYLKSGQTAVTMHPGWCKTDMGGRFAPLTPEQGAKRIYDCLWLKEVEQGRFYNAKFCDYYQCQ